MAAGSERLWGKLLDYIEERRVIPVVGEELLITGPVKSPKPLYRDIADRLATDLGIPLDGLASDYSLNEVVSRYGRAAERIGKEDLYREIRGILKALPAELPQPLLDLASIPQFDLFVSLTFDNLLAGAVNQLRFAGEARTEEIAYFYNDVQDLRSERKSLMAPVVFQLLGRASASPDYVICDDDMLEFVNALQDRARQPMRLFDELGKNHLLILGAGFGDWLARFFVRTAKSQPLSMKRHMEVLVSHGAASDPNLVTFFNTYSRETHLVTASPAAFAAELAVRWRERNPQAATAKPSAAPAATSDSGYMKPGAIFVSYARENLPAAQTLGQGLEAAGLDVWLDKGELQAGDAWDPKIRLNIESCSLFLPLISRATEAREEGYFRKEWNLAADRALNFADDMPFIMPVTLDGTPAYSARVPQRFRGAQWTPLADGQVTPAFADRLKQLVRDYHRRQRAA